MTVAAGVVIALIAVPEVRATTGVSRTTAVVEGVARGLIVAVPFAVAAYAWQRPAHARFGALLAAFSGIWFLAGLSLSASAVVYSVGRVAGWTAEVALAWVLLAFPTGRLEGRVDRHLTTIAIGVFLILYLPTALLVSQYPLPAPFTVCDARCPHNAFMVLHHQPAFIDGFVDPLRAILTVLVFLGVAIRLTARIRASNKLIRHTIVPVLAVSSVRMLLWVPTLALRQGAAHSAATKALAWALAVLVPAIALSFLVGVVRWRVFVDSAVRRVHTRLRGIPGPLQVRNALADVFEDPSLEIGYWLIRQQRWVTPEGQIIETPAARSGRYLTEVRESRREVAILHDAALRDESAFIDVSASLATMAFESERLSTRTAQMLRELTASRARITAAADSERRRIERDLHDGAQQRLVGLRIQLELAAQHAQENDPAEAASLRRLGDDVDRALDDMRSLAHGIYPAILSDRGLADAVGSAALRCPVATTVKARDLTDYPEEISTAVYLCCVEALQNVAKHAHGATAAEVVLAQEDSELHFSVSDDGPGFLARETHLGAGMVNMHDRIETVGGNLTVDSEPGHGTAVSGRIPLSVTARTPD